ncbi:TolC family protein [Treponema primitia]|uniref:TolC family protein n=1 Tax=Treponema primitia TaxID=88058 RepID=UPI00397EDF27
MKTKKRYTAEILPLVILLVLLAGFAAAEEAETLTLQQALDMAGNNNPALLASRQRWIEKQRSIAITNGWPNPEFGIMLEDIPSGGGKPMMYEYSLSQEIMAPAKLIAMRNMAKSEAGMAGADFSVKQLEVYTAVKQAYYDLLYAERSLAIMKENQGLMEHLVNITQTNYSHGTSPLQETLRAQAEISRMAVEIQNMTAMTAAARNRLNYLLGISANTPLTVEEIFTAIPPDFEFTALQNTAQNSPAIASMTWELEMARNNVSMAKSQFWPDFKLNFSFVQSTVMDPMLMKMVDTRLNRADYSLEMREVNRNSWKVGFMVMLPIWFGQYKAKAASAQAGVTAAQALVSDMRNMVGMELSMALNEAQSAWRLIGLYQNTVIPQAEQAYQASMVDYTNGKTDFMAALDGLVTLRNARLDYYKSRVDYEKALAYLEQLTGKPIATDSPQP